MIYKDAERRFVMLSDWGAMRESVLRDAVAARHPFQFAIAAMLLADARHRMVCHEKFNQPFARGLDLSRIGFHHHVLFAMADA